MNTTSPSPRILIANRGEIAVRVIRACREMGIPSIAVYSEADREAMHVEMADEAYLLGPATPAESYLNIEAILRVAAKARATLVHPGYGFLSERAEFSAAVAAAGFTFIGPPPEAMATLGDKISARRTAVEAGAPVSPGTDGPVDAARAIVEAGRVGFPLVVKAAFGGGGRGMRVVSAPDELEEAVTRAAREAQAYFGRPEVYLEHYVARAHHVEAQVLGDAHGNVSFLGERDCTLQRRHQKLVEESPSPLVDQELRRRIGEAAIRISAAAGYQNAGTVEFLLEEDGSFYFMEMNARLQVEHPVTEMVGGHDLVRRQIEVALGAEVRIEPDLRGHAIECRINAEDPFRDFLPGPGLVTRLDPPAGPFVRLDAGVEAGRAVVGNYDSLVAKLIVWGEDRETSRHRMLRALDELRIEGVPTTIPFHRWVLETPEFREATCTTNWVEEALEAGRLQAPPGAGRAGDRPATAPQLRPVRAVAEVDGRRIPVALWGDGIRTPPAPPPAVQQAAGGAAHGTVIAPMQGTILQVRVDLGQEVEAGTVVCVLEAMKMENHVATTQEGTVAEVLVSPGDAVVADQALVVIE